MPIRIEKNMAYSATSPQELEYLHHFMGIALQEAEKALQDDEVPIAAVLVAGQEIIAQNHNQTAHHNSNLAHAEMLVLEQAGQKIGRWRIRETTLFVTLEPCCMCAGAMVLARIAKVVYALADAKSGACGSIFNVPQEPRLNHQISIIGGIRSEESKVLLQQFFACKRRKPKDRRIQYYW